MPSIQATTYPVSAMAAAAVPVQAKNTVRTGVVKTIPPVSKVPGAEHPVSDRVKAYLATDPLPQRAATERNPDDLADGSAGDRGSGGASVVFDEALNYQPDWMS